jgi:hypothetical protein
MGSLAFCESFRPSSVRSKREARLKRTAEEPLFGNCSAAGDVLRSVTSLNWFT